MRTIGYIGIGLTGSLWLVASWRLAAHSISFFWNDEDDKERPRTEGVTMRRAFHGILWFAMLSETMGYANLAFRTTTDDDDEGDEKDILDERMVYVLLFVLGRAIFEFSAFALVAAVWFKSTACSRAGMSETHFIFSMSPIMLLFSGCCLGGFAIWETVELLVEKDWDLDEFKANSKVHVSRIFFEAVTWGSIGILVICNEIMIYNRLSRVASWSALDWKQKQPVLFRALGSMSVCSFCFLLRSAFLFANFFSLLETDTDFESGYVWWIFMVWIPTIVPSILLLYALRKVDRVPVAVEGITDSLLVQRQPPDAAFQAFRDMMDGESVSSSLVKADSIKSKVSSRSMNTAPLLLLESSDEESFTYR